MKTKCSDCKKEKSLEELVQVKDQYPTNPRYKLVCENCFRKKEYVYTGRFS